MAKKKIYRMILPMVLVVFAMATVLAGCGSGSNAAKSTSGTPSKGSNNTGSSNSGSVAKLTLWDIATHNDQKMIKDETTKFNKTNKAIQVNPQFFQNNPYKNKLRMALGAGNPPNIFYNWGGGGLKDYVDAGDVADLTSYINGDSKYKSKFPKSVWGPATFNGKIYGIPTQGMGAELMYYNKALFKKYNLDPPTTWDNVLKAAKVLKAHGVYPIALSGKSQWPEMILVQYLTNRLGGTQVFDKIAKGTPGAWSDPAVIQAMKYCQQLVDMGAFEPGYTSMDASKNQTEALLATDKAGMIAQGSWVYNIILTNYPDMIKNGKLGYVPFPEVDGKKENMKIVDGSPSAYYSISSKTKDVKAAITYLKDVNLNDSELKTYVNTLGLVPPVNGVDPLLKKSDNADFEIWLHDTMANASTVQLYWDQYLSATEAKQLLDNISKVFIKQETPEQFASIMNKDMAADTK